MSEHSTPPSFLEADISQIPAIQVLQTMGWSYLRPQELHAERRGRLGNVLLEGILETQLRRLNRVRFRGEERPFTDDALREAIATLRDVPADDGPVRTSERVYDLLSLGKSLDQNVDGQTRAFSLRYVDWAEPTNNVFHVAAEVEFTRTGSAKDVRRPDLVLYVNGIPFVVIECKRPDEKDSLAEAIKQHLRNQEPGEIPRVFTYAQLLLAVNKNEARYGTTATPRKFWAQWREQPGGVAVAAAVRALVNRPPRREEHEKLFEGRFGYAREFFLDLAAAGEREPTGQDVALWSLCRPERLIDLAQGFILFDAGEKKVARYQQYFTVKETVARVREREPGTGRRRGGVIWHTQGSGKSLTMVMLAKALVLDPGFPDPRLVLVTDRVDLDDQIWKTFHACGKEPVQARTGAHLIELLADGKASVITTVIDKFETAASAPRGGYVHDSDNVFVLVDESHRGQYGAANVRMQRTLPHACYLGFTGTPLLKKEKNTAQRFGGIIPPSYTITDAVRDGAVVPLLYEGRHVLQEVTAGAVDRMFEALSEGLTPEQKADLKRKFASRDELHKLDSKLQLVAWDVHEHFRRQWFPGGPKGQLAAPSKRAALRIKAFLDGFGKVSSEVLISGPDTIETDVDGAEAEADAGALEVTRFWERTMQRFGSEKEYNRAIIQRFTKTDDPQIIIVVSKLLTGFDAPRNTFLYIARSLREHTLLQAIARVNRLHEGKDYGYVIDYFGVLGELNKALEVYSALDAFDAADVRDAIADVSTALEELPQRHSELWDLFRDVSNRHDEEAYELALADQGKREEFYTRLSRFSRLMGTALATLRWVKQTPPERANRYRDDLVFFQKLRAAVKSRYAEEVDYREYEARIQKMLATYVRAEEVIQVTAPVDIFQREAFAAEVERATTPRAKADTIASRTKRTITERMEEDPFFYRRFSKLLEEAIEELHQQRLTDAAYLQRVTEIMEAVRDRVEDDVPAAVAGRGLARALFGVVREVAGTNGARSSSVVRESSAGADGTLTPEVAAEAAGEIERILRAHAVVQWRTNADVQNAMRNAMDDYLYGLRERAGLTLTLEDMDRIIEGALHTARTRQEL